MDKPKIIINSHSKEEQFKLILDTVNNVSLFNKRLISKEMRNHDQKTKAKINFPLLDVWKKLKIIDVLFGIDILGDTDSLEIIIFTIYEISYTLIFTTYRS
ncbi:hypothetical protein ACTFIR_007495 [Dictyostelium discoideum]